MLPVTAARPELTADVHAAWDAYLAAQWQRIGRRVAEAVAAAERDPVTLATRSKHGA